MTISVTDDHLRGIREFKIELTRNDYEDAPDVHNVPGWNPEPVKHSEVLRNLAIIAEAQERAQPVEAIEP